MTAIVSNNVPFPNNEHEHGHGSTLINNPDKTPSSSDQLQLQPKIEKEYAKKLAAMHIEMDRLQNECNDLSYKLTMSRDDSYLHLVTEIEEKKKKCFN